MGRKHALWRRTVVCVQEVIGLVLGWPVRRSQGVGLGKSCLPIGVRTPPRARSAQCQAVSLLGTSASTFAEVVT